MFSKLFHFAHSGFQSEKPGRAKARLAVSSLAGFLLASPGALPPLLAQDAGANAVPKARSVEEPRPAAPAEPVSARAGSAVLHPSDVISVSVFQEPDLEAKARLTEDGSVVLPLIGSVVLGGKTLKRAMEEVTALYKKDYLVDPLVTIFVIEHEQKELKKESTARVVVLGQVVRPGTVEIPADKGTPIMEAIAIAGGFTRIARESKITVKRLVSGKEQVFKVNGKDQAESGNTKIFLVYPGDVISVGESWF